MPRQNKPNVFKQNLAESELPKFLNGMHKQEQKRFLEIAKENTKDKK